MHDVMFFKKECGSNFIMASTSKADNLPEFSSCSLTDIKGNMDYVTSDPRFNCLQEDDTLPLEVSVLVSRGHSRHPHSVFIYVAFMFLVGMKVY